MLTCCKAVAHPWGRFNVADSWFPKELRCLVIGENPGDVSSPYFYDPPSNYSEDRVRVRHGLLTGLHACGMLPAARLESFRDAGFLFDHAIRCPLPPSIVKTERSAAHSYSASRVSRPIHLAENLFRAHVVWVTGHLANNAVGISTQPTHECPVSCQSSLSQRSYYQDRSTSFLPISLVGMKTTYR